MTLSYSAIWNDTTAMLRANGPLLVAIAGAFVFLPGLVVEYFIPPPEPARTLPEMLQQLSIYVGQNWHWSLLANLLNLVGALAIYMLLLEPGRRTVGSALVASITLLPSYFALWLMCALIVVVGGLLLIVPGLYLLGRVGVSGAAMVAERRLNPLDALAASFARTRGNGWAVAGLLVIVGIAGMVLILAFQIVLGSVFFILGDLAGAGEELGRLLVSILKWLLSAAYSTVMVVLLAAIYRALAAGSTNGT